MSETITLSWVGEESDSGQLIAVLSFSEGGTYRILLPRADEGLLTEIRSQLFPTEETSTADTSGMAGKEYERALKNTVHGDRDTQRTENLQQDWARAMAHSAELTLVVEGAEEIHAIPWEFILSREHSEFSTEMAIVRKLIGFAPPKQEHHDQPLRILLVVSRTYGPRDISHRHVADQLVRTFNRPGAKPIVDVLRGGATFDNLRKRLSQVPYQIVHFDMHGELFQKEGHLLFEKEQIDHDDDADRTGAGSVAELLKTHGVQLAIFTACESARPWISDHELGKSLSHEMAFHGVPATIGMSNPLSSSGAKQFSSLLYDELFISDTERQDRTYSPPSIAEAFRAARLRFRTDRQESEEGFCEEWRLPTLFLRTNQNAVIEHGGSSTVERPEQGLEIERPWNDRDFDHRLIDRQLFSQNMPVLIRGLQDTGKSRLLDDLATWWRLATYAKAHVELDCSEDDLITSLVDQLETQFPDFRAPSDTATEGDLEDAIRVAAAVAVERFPEGRESYGEVIFYLKKADRCSPRAALLVKRLVRLASEDVVHVVMTGRSKPAYLSDDDYFTFDMLWVDSSRARQYFFDLVDFYDERLISICSDLPGVVKKVAEKYVENGRTMSESPIYFNAVLPDPETLLVGLTPMAILPFAGIKTLPLPLLQRELLIEYLKACKEQEVLACDMSPDGLVSRLETLGLLAPMGDPMSPAGTDAPEMLRIHPFLPLLARKCLREHLEVTEEEVADGRLRYRAHGNNMRPYSSAYGDMQDNRTRVFGRLRSNRRVELWYWNPVR